MQILEIRSDLCVVRVRVVGSSTSFDVVVKVLDPLEVGGEPVFDEREGLVPVLDHPHDGKPPVRVVLGHLEGPVRARIAAHLVVTAKKGLERKDIILLFLS